MLRECLRSILAQTQPDFEVIVGNDYVQRPVDLAELGIVDPRVRVINHTENLGERRNLNALLDQGRGAFFTWQADDDFYDPGYLKAIEGALELAPTCAAVFTGYRVARGDIGPSGVAPVGVLPTPRVLRGSAFLKDYWRGRIRTMGLVGMYRREYLLTRGGVAALAPGAIAVMSEYDLIVHCGLLPAVAFVDAPLVLYRAHASSWSTSTATATATSVAGLELLRRSVTAFSQPALGDDLDLHLEGLVRLVVTYVLKTQSRERGTGGLVRRALAYLHQLTVVTRDVLADRPAAMRRARRAAWTQFARLLPQLLFIRGAPGVLRDAAVRVRAIYRGEVIRGTPAALR